jgi:hypothetical protein
MSGRLAYLGGKAIARKETRPMSAPTASPAYSTTQRVANSSSLASSGAVGLGALTPHGVTNGGAMLAITTRESVLELG